MTRPDDHSESRKPEKKSSSNNNSNSNSNNNLNDEDSDMHPAAVARLPDDTNNQRQHSPRKKKKRSLTSSKSHHRRRKHHHGDSTSKPSAAAAAASPKRSEMGAGSLVESFRDILEGGGDQPDIDAKKAANAMEATAGNMQLAAQLFWDDYFASQANRDEEADLPPARNNLADEADQKLPAERNPFQESLDSDDDQDGGDDDDDESLPGQGRHPHRKLRRSLDKAFGRAVDEDQEAGAQRDEAMEDIDEQEEVQEDNQQNQRMVEANVGQQPRLRDMGESVSISDDEAGGSSTWRIVGRTVEGAKNSRKNRRHKQDDLERRIREAAAAVAKKVSPNSDFDEDEESERRKRRKEADEKEENDQDYISDSDWLEEEGNTTSDPFETLWGKGTTNAESSSPSADEENRAEGNVVADEDIAEQQEDDAGSGIPHSWLNASFSLSSCGMGMALKPPRPEDIEFFAWRQQQNQERSSRPGVPPPYHCKSITAVISTINAMLLTGASIQGKEVNCTSAKKPFANLSSAVRKQEFEMRLTDAIAALIFIAAKASMQRKKRAIARAKVSASGKQNEMKIQKMRRRLYRIPTCTWEDDPTSGMPQGPDGPSHRNVQVTTSLTNIDDIRLYVLSSISAFTAPGGVALLLETILRIHGTGVISRMLERTKGKTKEASLERTLPSLICCTCEERQRKELEKNPIPPSARNDPAKMTDTTPPGHECVSVEFMSLLLTGRVESSWKGWSTKGLDFGILSSEHGKMGWELARPAKPVWILEGDTCYSILHLRDCKEADLKTMSKLDTCGAVFEFAHWNCWYGQRNESSLRLTTAAGKWNPPGLSSKPSVDKWQGCRGPMESRDTVELLKERLHVDRWTNKRSASEHDSTEAKEMDSPITPKELEATKSYPDDERLYPGKHCMWRFNMGEDEKENLEDGERKQRAEVWTPYHRLTARQKLIVELKLGPRISCILWTRWPNSTIDNFTPVGKDPPIV